MATVDIYRRNDPVALLKRDCPQGNVEIIGIASTHTSLTSEAEWQIKRVVTVSGVETTEFADHGKYNQVWDNRLDLFVAVVEEEHSKADIQVDVVKSVFDHATSALFNLTVLIALGDDLSTYLTNNDGEIIYNHNGSLLTE